MLVCASPTYRLQLSTSLLVFLPRFGSNVLAEFLVLLYCSEAGSGYNEYCYVEYELDFIILQILTCNVYVNNFYCVAK